MSLSDYIEKHKDPVTGEPPPTGWTLADHYRRKAGQTEEASEVQYASAEQEQRKDHLTDEERQQFEERYKLLYRQADEDPALGPMIREIVMGEINLSRYQAQLARLSANMTTKKISVDDVDQIKKLNDIVKILQESNLKLLNSLSLTREKKQANRKGHESTPVKLATQYEYLLRTLPADEIRKLNEEMREASARLRDNVQRLTEVISDSANPDPFNSSSI
jgi:flagellar capping protein FliD